MIIRRGLIVTVHSRPLPELVDGLHKRLLSHGIKHIDLLAYHFLDEIVDRLVLEVQQMRGAVIAVEESVEAQSVRAQHTALSDIGKARRAITRARRQLSDLRDVLGTPHRRAGCAQICKCPRRNAPVQTRLRCGCSASG